ncbi:acyltransferase family protein [Pseudomonas lini]
MKDSTRVQWLDVCRTLAILLVLMSHGRSFLLPVAPWLQSLKFGGFLGVELFFVLSGFLIGLILIRETEKASSPFSWIPIFWISRWLRTIPNYLLFLILNIILSYNIRPAELPAIFSYLTFTQNLAWEHPPFFAEAWSLAVEEMFYLVTPLVIATFMLFTKNAKHVILLTSLSIFSLSIIARFILVLHNDPVLDEGVRKISALRLDALMSGVLLAWLYYSSKISKVRINILSFCLLPLFFLSIKLASISDAELNSSFFLRIFIFNIASFGCAGLILIGMDFKFSKFFERVFLRVARWSYSAYLTNLPVLFALRYLFPEPDSLYECIALWVSYLALTLISACLVYETFEKRFLALRRKILSPGVYVEKELAK